MDSDGGIPIRVSDAPISYSWNLIVGGMTFGLKPRTPLFHHCFTHSQLATMNGSKRTRLSQHLQNPAVFPGP
jgi:hypothetical protein